MDGYSDDELADEVLSRSLSPSESGPREPVGDKRERLRAVLLPAIQSRVTALGGWEDVEIVRQHDRADGVESDEEELEAERETIKVYKLGDECLGCLKDLKRYWRMDDNDDDRNIARIFYETGLLKNDLIPILNHGSQMGASARHEKAALASADLIAAMTWPINVIEELREAELSGNKEAIEAIQKVDYAGLIAAQRQYKKSVLQNGAIKSLVKMLVPRLEKGLRERTQRDENIISLILHIWRNLASIKDKPATTHHSADALEEANLQSELIKQFSSENIFDLLITISSLANKTEFNQWNMICLEIFYLLFRGVEKPETLVQRSADASKVIREERLSSLLQAEATRKRLDGRKGVTRHSRFGTTVVIEAGKDRIVMHKQSAVAAAAVNPGKVMDEGRKQKKLKVRADSELAPHAELTVDAVEVLQIVAMSFLESAFNPFFGSVLKDIRMERAKVREIDNIRFLFLVRFFLQYFLALYAFERTKEIDPKHEDAHDFDLIAEMTETASILYVCQRMTMSLEEKPPLWTELHASVECFVQLLLVIDALMNSGNEDYKEVSEILQNKLYYQKETLDMVLTVLKTYNAQPLKYLDSIVHLNYVLLRMLEKYSKNRDFMYVRKKASGRAKKKRAQADEDEERLLDEEEAEVEAAKQDFKDHQFQFADFENRFADPACVQTVLVYLAGYKNFAEEDQMKRAVNLLHRAAVRASAEGLFFKATTLELFRRIIDDRAYLPKTAAYKDLGKLINYVLKKFFKVAQENPLLLIEVFYPHRKGSIEKIFLGQESDYEEDDGPKAMKLPAELEVKKSKGYSWSQQVGIAVALLSDMNRDDLLTWVKDTISLVAKEREAIVVEVNAQRLAQIEAAGPEEDEDEEDFARRKMLTASSEPSEEAKAALSDYNVPYNSDDEREFDCTRNIELKLLLRLLKWESREAAELKRLEWALPASLLPTELFSFVKVIDDFLIEPLNPENGESVHDLIQKKRKAPKTRAKAQVEQRSDEEDDVLFSDPEAAAAINGGKKLKRKRGSKKGEGAAGRSVEGGAGGGRRKKRMEEAKIYRTAEFIEDSDDDEDANRAFFEREAQLRRNMEMKSGLGGHIVLKSKKAKKDRKDKKHKSQEQKDKAKARASGSEDDEDEEADSANGTDSDASSISPAKAPLASIKARPRAKPVVKKAKAASPAPTDRSSSPVVSSSSIPTKRGRPLSSDEESEAGEGNAHSEQENESPVKSALAASARRPGRMIVDSDDDE